MQVFSSTQLDKQIDIICHSHTNMRLVLLNLSRNVWRFKQRLKYITSSERKLES